MGREGDHESVLDEGPREVEVDRRYPSGAMRDDDETAVAALRRAASRDSKRKRALLHQLLFAARGVEDRDLAVPFRACDLHDADRGMGRAGEEREDGCQEDTGHGDSRAREKSAKVTPREARSLSWSARKF